jgi:putative colanic acid biosynthesis glycosyltransferase
MNKSISVLQVNVRLNEGGAAGVALDLHNRLQKKDGFFSHYSYGYSKGGRPNPIENDFNAQHIASKFQAAANLISYKVLNYDLLKPTGTLKNKFIKEIESADIIHLHVVHSYFMSFSWLVDILINSGKKIIWTLHDHWIVTGRCAFNDGCIQWKNSCGACPTLSNYPPVWLDRSGAILPKKRKLILKLADTGCVFVSPSIHLLNDVRSVFPEIDIRLVHNALDIETEVIIKSTTNHHIPRIKNSPIRVLIIAHDLNYQGKTNQDLINKIRTMTNIELHTVGKNSPFAGEHVFNHGYVKSKKNLYEIYENIDLMLFTSIVDNFPLVIGEALSVGVPVIASNSAAANEVLSLVGACASQSDDEIINALLEENWMKHFYAEQSLEDVRNKAILAFSGSRLLGEYIAIYE